jgi:hypothetical protein
MTKGVRRKRATPRRRLAPQQDSTWWEWATQALLRRCGFRCERCGTDLGDELERHHRQRRQVGGDRLANLMALHPRCHAYITEHPAEAMANGWIVTSHGPGGVAPDPREVPVRLPGLGGTALWLLDDKGGKAPVP